MTVNRLRAYQAVTTAMFVTGVLLAVWGFVTAAGEVRMMVGAVLVTGSLLLLVRSSRLYGSGDPNRLALRVGGVALFVIGLGALLLGFLLVQRSGSMPPVLVVIGALGIALGGALLVGGRRRLAI